MLHFREVNAAGAAVLLHAGVLVVATALVTSRPEVAISSSRLRADIEVDLIAAPPLAPSPAEPAAAEPEAPSSEASSTPVARVAGAAAVAASPAPAAEGAIGTPQTPGPAEATAPPGPSVPRGPAVDEYSPPSAAPVVPGVGAAPVWSVPGAIAVEVPRPAATAPAAPHPTDSNVAGKVIEGTLRKKDQELGFEVPSAGIVAGAVASAVRGVETTDDARATFEVALGETGQVRGVKVVSFSTGDAGQWERAAKRAASSLAGRGLDTQGEPITVVVKVDSKQLYPAGSKEKVEAQPVCVNEVIEDVAIALGELAGDSTTPAPQRPATLDPRKRFCIPIGLAGNGDLSNVGAHKQTVVHSTFKVVRTGDRKLPSDRAKPVDDSAPWIAPAEGVEKRYPMPKWKPKKKKDKDKNKGS